MDGRSKKGQIDKIEIMGLLQDDPIKWTNSALAERYGVSVVSVWRCRKRIADGKKPKEKVLKPDEITYVEQRSIHPTATLKQMGEICFPELSLPAIKAARIDKLPQVQQALKDKLDAVGLTSDYKAEKIKKHCDSDDDNTSLKGLDMAIKVAGDYAPKENLNVNLNADIGVVDLERFKTR